MPAALFSQDGGRSFKPCIVHTTSTVRKTNHLVRAVSAVEIQNARLPESQFVTPLGFDARVISASQINIWKLGTNDN